MGLELPSGGHVSCRYSIYCTLSGKLSSTSIFIEKLSYKVNPQIGYVNKLEERAKISTPRFSYVVGAHTPERDFTRMRIIADKCVNKNFFIFNFFY